MACCGAQRDPGQASTAPIVLGDDEPGGMAVYARVMASGVSLAPKLRANAQYYFAGSGVDAALEAGMIVDVSAAAIQARRAAMRHEWAVVHPDGTRERYGVWQEAKTRAAEVGGRIEVIPIIEGGQ